MVSNTREKIDTPSRIRENTLPNEETNDASYISDIYDQTERQSELINLNAVDPRTIPDEVLLRKRGPQCDNILIQSPFVRNLCLLKRKIITID